MTGFTYVALVSPQNAIERISLARLIDLDAGTKPGWRWLPIIEEYGEPFGDTVEADRVLRLIQDPATVPQPKRQVFKPLIERRIGKHAGKLDQVMGILVQNWSLFVRWQARDHDYVDFDDPDTVRIIRLVDLTPEEIMAEGDD